MLTPRRTSDSPIAAIAIGAFLGRLPLGGILGLGLGAVLTWAATATLLRRRRRPRCDERISDE